MTETTIAAALTKAQAKMGKAIKDSTNPAFRSKYADLGSVMDACLPALNECGISVIQPFTMTDGKYGVETILLHESGERLSCTIPLIVNKNDMQGLGSAMTYARRYGLMCMAGIAPEEDDGNAAGKAPPVVDPVKPVADPVKPVKEPPARDPERVANSLIEIIKTLPAAEVASWPADGSKASSAWDWLELDHKPHAARVKAAHDKRKAELTKPADLGGDEIPY